DFGFVSCGVILGLFPADVDFKGLTGKIIQKESALLIFMPFETPTRIIYPPARHAEVIDEIFVRCKIGVTVGDLSSACHGKDEVPSRTNTRLSYSRIEVFNTADIFCYADDIGMVNDILAAKKQLCVERTDVLFLFLDLEQPGCMELAEACEAMGFFFAGVLPYGLNGKHTLILQFLNNLTIDYTKIALCDPFAQHLLDYVQLCGQAN
ncbi:MAG: hypothetical protein U9R69_00105, partial [Thermodesulfobacteriota bacterium]|nr:hypothetical protein [Thermodesulfobacteriota bacterium]